MNSNMMAFGGMESDGDAGITLDALHDPARRPAIREGLAFCIHKD